MINEEEREKRQLNNSTSTQINRGFELMLLYLNKKKEKNSQKRKKTFEINLSQNLTFFNKNVDFNFVLNFDVKEKKTGE
jgi:hypothetical protein